MKIRIKNSCLGTHKNGDVVKALQNPKDENWFLTYDSEGMTWIYSADSIVIIEEDVLPSELVKVNSSTTLKELLGQEVSEIKFK